MSAVLNTDSDNYTDCGEGIHSPVPGRDTALGFPSENEPGRLYAAMLKQNKDAPLCLPLQGSGLHHYMVGLKEHARQLYNTIASLGGTDSSGLLSGKSACSSHPDIIGVKGNPSPLSSDTLSLSLQVIRLASTQENLGSFLKDGRLRLAPDTYSFDIGLGDMNYEFQFVIHRQDTVRELQGRLVRLINQADIGLRASLEEDNRTDRGRSERRSAVRLTSSSYGLRPGQQLQFTVSDAGTGMRSGVVDYLGLNHIAHHPANARLLLERNTDSSKPQILREARPASEAVEIEKSSNEFDLDHFHLKLFSTTPPGESVTIGYKDDLESFLDNAAALAEGYNSFLKGTALYADLYPRSRRLTRETEHITSLYKEDLESMGMYIQEDGTLTLDPSALLTARGAEDSIPDYARTLREFSRLLLAKAYQVSLNPMEYTEKRVVAYKNPGRTFISPYVVSAYSGMMFSGYC